MKTNYLLPTLLAVIIQVMVSGQTQDNQITQVKKTLINTENSIINVTYSTNSTGVNLADLLKQAQELNNTSLSFRNASKTKFGDEKKELIKEAVYYEKQYIAKQIEISELLAKETYQKLSQNRNYIHVLLKSLKDDEYTTNLVLNLNFEAEKSIRMAKEMREEAYAQPNNNTKLGNMTNAEEEETIALNKQQLVFDIIERVSPKVTIR